MLNQLSQKIHEVMHEKGFYTHPHNPPCQHKSGSVAAQIMLVVTELAEAVEADRYADFENFKEEIADAMIRLFDLAAAQDIDLDEAIKQKMEYNKQRPYRHGKRY